MRNVPSSYNLENFYNIDSLSLGCQVLGSKPNQMANENQSTLPLKLSDN